MKLSMKVFGLDAIRSKLKGTGEDRMARIRKAGRKAAYLVDTEVKKMITESIPAGRMYGTHRASAPGQPPAVDTGALIGSIHVEFPDEDTSLIVANTPYAAALEFGRDDGSIQERPFMRPGFANAKPAIDVLMKEASGGR